MPPMQPAAAPSPRDRFNSERQAVSDERLRVRPIDFARDEAPLKSFLTARDRMRLDHLEAANRDGHCFVYVADNDGIAVGWAVVHTQFRADQDWDPPDEDTHTFQSADNAYLENIEVAPRYRSRGVGRQLIEAVQAEAKRRKKRHLWLHTSENNKMAHALFDREGWNCERTVYPTWKPTVRMRVYHKVL